MCEVCGGMCYMRRDEGLMKDLYFCRWCRLYGVDINVAADRQGHKCIQLLINPRAEKMSPIPQNI